MERYQLEYGGWRWERSLSLRLRLLDQTQSLENYHFRVTQESSRVAASNDRCQSLAVPKSAARDLPVLGSLES